MERTLSANYPVQIKGVLFIEYVRLNPRSKDTLLYINTECKKG